MIWYHSISIWTWIWFSIIKRGWIHW